VEPEPATVTEPFEVADALVDAAIYPLPLVTVPPLVIDRALDQKIGGIFDEA
jgi:hypothetical protein